MSFLDEYERKRKEAEAARLRQCDEAQARVEAGERPQIVRAYFGVGWAGIYAEVRDTAGESYRIPEKMVEGLMLEVLKGRRIAATARSPRQKYLYVTQLEPKEDGR